MTLAWGLLLKLTPKEERGATTGLATMTKGIALLLGPAIVGRGDRRKPRNPDRK